MYKNIFKYHFLEAIRQKSYIFWDIIFPLALATIFIVAFGGIDKPQSFSNIPIGVENPYYKKILEQIKTNDKPLFDIKEVTDVNKSLEDDSIAVYVKGDMNNVKVISLKDTIQAKVAYGVVNSIHHGELVVGDLVKQGMNISQIPNAVKSFSTYKGAQITSGFDTSSTKATAGYFISLLTMVCLGSSTMGIFIFENINVKGGLPTAKRMVLSPINRTKYLLTMGAVDLVVTGFASLLTLFYVRYVAGVVFANLPLAVFSMIIGTILGLLIGLLIAVALPIKTEYKLMVSIGVYLVSSFSTGLQSRQLAYYIEKNIPFFGMVNPGSLIYKLFQNQYYYTDMSNYLASLRNIGIAISILMVLILVLIRRRRYDTI